MQDKSRSFGKFTYLRNLHFELFFYGNDTACTYKMRINLLIKDFNMKMVTGLYHEQWF